MKAPSRTMRRWEISCCTTSGSAVRSASRAPWAIISSPIIRRSSWRCSAWPEYCDFWSSGISFSRSSRSRCVISTPPTRATTGEVSFCPSPNSSPFGKPPEAELPLQDARASTADRTRAAQANRRAVEGMVMIARS
ncbi:MAG: hypothetical protein IPI34_11730 [bacterium]|nr:hypothetical protein [bacterium]